MCARLAVDASQLQWDDLGNQCHENSLLPPGQWHRSVGARCCRSTSCPRRSRHCRERNGAPDQKRPAGPARSQQRSPHPTPLSFVMSAVSSRLACATFAPSESATAALSPRGSMPLPGGKNLQVFQLWHAAQSSSRSHLFQPPDFPRIEPLHRSGNSTANGPAHPRRRSCAPTGRQKTNGRRMGGTTWDRTWAPRSRPA